MSNWHAISIQRDCHYVLLDTTIPGLEHSRLSVNTIKSQRFFTSEFSASVNLLNPRRVIIIVVIINMHSWEIFDFCALDDDDDDDDGDYCCRVNL